MQNMQNMQNDVTAMTLTWVLVEASVASETILRSCRGCCDQQMLVDQSNQASAKIL